MISSCLFVARGAIAAQRGTRMACVGSKELCVFGSWSSNIQGLWSKSVSVVVSLLLKFNFSCVRVEKETKLGTVCPTCFTLGFKCYDLEKAWNTPHIFTDLDFKWNGQIVIINGNQLWGYEFIFWFDVNTLIWCTFPGFLGEMEAICAGSLDVCHHVQMNIDLPVFATSWIICLQKLSWSISSWSQPRLVSVCHAFKTSFNVLFGVFSQNHRQQWRCRWTTMMLFSHASLRRRPKMTSMTPQPHQRISGKSSSSFQLHPDHQSMSLCTLH